MGVMTIKLIFYIYREREYVHRISCLFGVSDLKIVVKKNIEDHKIKLNDYFGSLFEKYKNLIRYENLSAKVYDQPRAAMIEIPVFVNGFEFHSDQYTFDYFLGELFMICLSVEEQLVDFYFEIKEVEIYNHSSIHITNIHVAYEADEFEADDLHLLVGDQ